MDRSKGVIVCSYRKAIHHGWMPRNSEANKPSIKLIKQGGEQYLEVGPLVLECDPLAVTDDDWLKIKSWMQRVIPHRGQRLQLLFTFGSRELPGSKPLKLQLSHEQVAISKDQRDRVNGTFRHHQSGNQLAQLKVVLRQNVRLA